MLRPNAYLGKLSFLGLTLCLIFLHWTSVVAANDPVTEFRPGEIWNDTDGTHINAHGGGILYHNGTYYWFGEHKIGGDAGNKAHVGVGCYSSKDLYNWKNEGIALRVSDDPKSDITKECVLERPKVIYNAKTKKFVMWFHLELKGRGYSAARSGVATSDTVTGPYTFLKSFRPDKGTKPINFTNDPADKTLSKFNRDFDGGQMARDMTLFVDDDQKAYLLYASEDNETLHISRLTDDYLGTSGEFVRVFIGRSMEAPAIFKKNGKYYFIGSGCTGWAPNAARSAVADSIFGPWKELGNPCIGEHAGLTFHSQSTYLLPVVGKKDAFIFMADRWTPKNAIDGRYVWLPIEFENDRPVLHWRNSWNLNFFNSKDK
ncbi:MAG: glycoside hydrolase family 43 protein [Puniceicoccales bacterium]|jgi:beta-xylosidase|nr:glycoside hydrolase family 43 protein [Puniceicoccales bacterium]